jgi:flagellar biosynthesis regulator FlaF
LRKIAILPHRVKNAVLVERRAKSIDLAKAASDPAKDSADAVKALAVQWGVAVKDRDALWLGCQL